MWQLIYVFVLCLKLDNDDFTVRYQASQKLLEINNKYNYNNALKLFYEDTDSDEAHKYINHIISLYYFPNYGWKTINTKYATIQIEYYPKITSLDVDKTDEIYLNAINFVKVNLLNRDWGWIFEVQKRDITETEDSFILRLATRQYIALKLIQGFNRPKLISIVDKAIDKERQNK